MPFSHKQLILKLDSIYVDRIDPVKKTSFKVADTVIVCSKAGDAITQESLDILKGICPFCGENSGSHSTLPPVVTTPYDGKNLKSKPDPGNDNKRYRSIPWGVIAIFGTICLAIGLVIGFIPYIITRANPSENTTEVPSTVYSPKNTATIAYTLTSVPSATHVVKLTNTTLPKPTSTPELPAFNVNDPDGFITWYFDTICKDNDYESKWEFMTDSFKNKNSPGGYEEYAKVWSYIVNVEIGTITFKGKSNGTLHYAVHLKFNYKNGLADSGIYNYYLRFDDKSGHWMFDRP